MRSLLSLLLLASAGFMAGGCATAGMALVGPLAGTVTAIVDRSVDRTLPADLSTTWGATADALARMAVRIEETDKSGPKWRLTGTGGATTVHGTLESVTAGMTKVSVRVEVGGLFADKDTSDELLNQISASLASFASMGRRDGTASAADASIDQFRVLQRQIERLGTKIEEAREAPPPTARSTDALPAQTVSPTSVIMVPASAGVATVPVPAAHPAREAIPSALRASTGPRNTAVPQGRAAEQQEGRSDDILAAPMSSVEVLRPVEGLRTRPSGR
ncbi:MAG TPA: DUF3568 family protein [Candidatus Limnocylindria bacterium]|nr:DUF3568 family protein [Candidatus Limnocylindria bacterium]